MEIDDTLVHTHLKPVPLGKSRGVVSTNPLSTAFTQGETNAFNNQSTKWRDRAKNTRPEGKEVLAIVMSEPVIHTKNSIMYVNMKKETLTVLVPSPQGDFLTVRRRTLVGMRTGPLTLRFFSLAPLIKSAQTCAQIRVRKDLGMCVAACLVYRKQISMRANTA